MHDITLGPNLGGIQFVLSDVTGVRSSALSALQKLVCACLYLRDNFGVIWLFSKHLS